MVLHIGAISVGVLSSEQWAHIGIVTTFMRAPQQVIESLTTYRKTLLDLVAASIMYLIKHCECEEAAL